MQANLPKEEERLKALMDDYAKTMLMLDQSNLEEENYIIPDNIP